MKYKRFACSVCGKSKRRAETGKTWRLYGKYKSTVFVDPKNRQFVGNACPDCRKLRLRSWQKEYGRTKTGFLVTSYVNMKRRCKGMHGPRYKGFAYPEKEPFYAWANADCEFHRLFVEYGASGFDRRFCPSVDRIDPKHGYFFENMRWIPSSENSRRSCLGLNKKPPPNVTQMAKDLRNNGYTYFEISKKMKIAQMTAWKYVNTY